MKQQLRLRFFHKQVSTFQVWLTAYEATQANVHRCMRNAHRPPCGTQQHVHVDRLDGCLDSVGCFFFSVRSKTIRIGRLLGCHICICPPGVSSRAAADDGLCVRGPSGSHGFSLCPLLCQSPLPLSLLSFLLAPSLAASSSATSLLLGQQHAAGTGLNRSQEPFLSV